MLKTTLVLAGVGALLTLTACQNPEEPLRPGFGNAVRHNISQHVINPEPAAADLEVHRTEGVRAAGAMQRYDTGATKALEVVKTTEGK